MTENTITTGSAPRKGFEGPDLGEQEMRDYVDALNVASVEIPSLMGRRYAEAQQAIESGQRQGMRSMAQEAARGMAAAMGQAGAMPVGGGSAATLRQTGRSFGQSAADFAQQAAQRAADLETQHLDRQMSLYGEILPGLRLAAAEGVGKISDIQRAPQDELTWLATEIGAIKDNNYWDEDRARNLNAIIGTLTPGSPAHKLAIRQMQAWGYNYSPAGAAKIPVGSNPPSQLFVW